MTTVQSPPNRAARKSSEERLGWLLALPALGIIALVSVFPIAWTFWESLHLDDLRMPWLGRPFIGWGNYIELAADRRFWSAVGHTAFFAGTSVALELASGLALALMLDRIVRARHLVRTIVVLPWAIPTVVAALVWRFMFESPGGLVTAGFARLGVVSPTWFADEWAAWVPLVLSDTWKTTPFVALLLLAGLQNIDRTLYEAADVDGATSWQQFTGITLPLLAPAILVAALFRLLDAFRVFDVVFVMTGGGPGTGTETSAIYTFSTLLQHLRFGYGSALSIFTFVVTFALALAAIRAFGVAVLPERQR